MTTDMSLIALIAEASLLVKLVMLLLLVASVGSWYLIFRKRQVLAKARRAAEAFEDAFWSGRDLLALYNKMNSSGLEPRGIERIFVAGFREFARLRSQPGSDQAGIMDGTQRAMRVAVNREVDDLELHLPLLATIGSTSPYIGLFGTVWGIMNSFRALGEVQQATLSMVAPGIAEALIATAMGLFAAIPAVIAYNRYVSDVERLQSRYEIFTEEFSSILQRQSHAS